MIEFIQLLLVPSAVESWVANQLKHQIGFMLQFIVLTITPLISWWQLQFGFELIWMPGLLLAAAILFTIGTRLRESR